MFEWDQNYPLKRTMDSASLKLAAIQAVTLQTDSITPFFFGEICNIFKESFFSKQMQILAV